MTTFEGFPKRLPLVFAITVAIYLAAFYGIEHMRSRKGPWFVGYETDGQGRPTIVVNQPSLGISNVRIIFAEETAPTDFRSATVTFTAPEQVPFAQPFGECFFQDLTFLPGTVTLRPFPGHEIELLPRALYVNRREQAWVSGATYEEFQTNRVPHLVAEELTRTP